MPVTVYFATNRRATDPADWSTYNAEAAGAPGDMSAVSFGTAFVSDTVLEDEASGQIETTGTVTQSGFNKSTQADIVGSGKNLLIFLHGFANNFRDGVARAAFNQAWFAASGLDAADTTVLVFSWPSLGRLIAPPPHLAPHQYWTDQAQAARSGLQIKGFLLGLVPLVKRVRSKGQRCFLLAHSMGNYALQAAVESWFLNGHAAMPLFDEAFLAAADERWDSFEAPVQGRLSRLQDLAARIHVYHSVRDIAMLVSPTVNWTRRLGFLGPEHRDDPARFPPARFRTVDCAGVNDYLLNTPPDASHQYYRRSRRVRADIAAAMAGQNLPAGVCAL